MSQELGSLWLSERGEHLSRLEGMSELKTLPCEVPAASAPAEGKSKLPESIVGPLQGACCSCTCCFYHLQGSQVCLPCHTDDSADLKPMSSSDLPEWQY